MAKSGGKTSKSSALEVTENPVAELADLDKSGIVDQRFPSRSRPSSAARFFGRRPSDPFRAHRIRHGATDQVR